MTINIRKTQAKRITLFCYLFFAFLGLPAVSAQEVGTDEYLIAKDTLIEDLYKSRRVKRAVSEEPDLTFTDGYNSAFNNAVRIELAARHHLNAWYNRQFTVLKEHINKMFHENYSHFDEARNRLFLESEKAKFISLATSLRRSKNREISVLTNQNNKTTSDLVLLALRKEEINTGKTDTPRFPFINVAGIPLKDYKDIRTIDQIYNQSEETLGNAISKKSRLLGGMEVINDLIDHESTARQAFDQYILDKKIGLYKNKSKWDKLNGMQGLINYYQWHKRHSSSVEVFPGYEKIADLNQVISATSIENYARLNTNAVPSVFSQAFFQRLLAKARVSGGNRYADTSDMYSSVEEDWHRAKSEALKNLLNGVNTEDFPIANVIGELDITSTNQKSWLYNHKEEAQQIIDYLEENRVAGSVSDEAKRFSKDFLEVTNKIENETFAHYQEVAHLVRPNYQEIASHTFSESVDAWYGNESTVALEDGKLKVQSTALWSSVRKRLPQRVTAGNHIVGTVFIDLENTEALGIGVSKFNDSIYKGIDNIIDLTQGWNTFEYNVPEGVNALDFKIFKNVEDGVETSYAIDNFKLNLDGFNIIEESIRCLRLFPEIIPLIYIDSDSQWPIKFSIRVFAPSGAFKGYGFHDDGRSFSTSDNVTSRIYHEFTVDATAQIHSSQDPVSHPTIKTESGNSKTGRPDGIVSVNYGDVGQVNISQQFEGSNPFYYGLAPDIEVQTRISVLENVDLGTIIIEAIGTGKQFPATESFATDNAGNSLFVGVGAAYGEPSDLLTSSKNNPIFKTTLKINVNSDGVFQSVNYKGKDYSLEDYNKLFTSQEEGPLDRDKRPKN